MNVIKWDDALLTGNKMIDDQHKEIIKCAGNLLEHLQSGEGKKAVKSTLEYLQNYVIKHFKEEEEFQKKCNYSNVIEHKKIMNIF